MGEVFLESGAFKGLLLLFFYLNEKNKSRGNEWNLCRLFLVPMPKIVHVTFKYNPNKKNSVNSDLKLGHPA